MMRLAAERERQGLSRAELGRRTRIHPTDLSQIERGRRTCHPGWLARLAAELGVTPPEALLDEVTVEHVITPVEVAR